MSEQELQRERIESPVALVTGSGAPRIGNCVVRTLAAKGYRVVLHARTSLAEAEATAEELRADGKQAVVVSGDVRDERAVREMTARALDAFGRIDGLVNCAAVWHARPFEEVTAELVREHLETNVLGAFLCARHVGLVMVGQNSGGAIVNFGDWATVRPYLDYAAYFPSKGAIPAMTRDLAVELGTRNPRVRVNAILPGPVMLPDTMPAEERRKVIDATLAKREGSPQHVADAVLFLLENDYVTGVCLPVDGGRSIYAG
ncbi:MAG TPA: SDR family oxidoreductase [Pirellulales bacterium]|nr:SDR family oxidoreductase [Pirellulales bacterium]